MNNWWHKWADIVAQALAEQWLSSRTKEQNNDQAHIPEVVSPQSSPHEGPINDLSINSQDKDDDA